MILIIAYPIVCHNFLALVESDVNTEMDYFFAVVLSGADWHIDKTSVELWRDVAWKM